MGEGDEVLGQSGQEQQMGSEALTPDTPRAAI